ncbi:MAG: cytochrome c biogenesis protein CcdA [Dehalococcoidales bacterium]|nr:cytochrome c biogenesis protein CcdA [Dehalococcoidales bacterium]
MGNFVTNLVNLVPFGYAFAAGMVTTVSPCGIAMLPPYVSLYLGNKSDTPASSMFRRSARALKMSGAVTLSFAAFFGAMGALLSAGGYFLTGFIPWLAVIIGVGLILTGIYLISGGHIYTSLPARLAARLKNPGSSGTGGFMLFGIIYAIAALSCSLPIFLAVVGSALAVKGFTAALLQFVSYSLGMGFVITLVAMGATLFSEVTQQWLKRLVPLVARFSGFLLIFAGAYILYYWFIVGNILSLTF